MRIAVVAYRPELIDSVIGLRMKLESVVEDSVAQDAQLIVFPEYAGLEMAGLSGLSRISLREIIPICDRYKEEYLQILSDLAAKYQVVICGGSFPCTMESMKVNWVPVASPGKEIEFQSKQIATPFERTDWEVEGKAGLKVFEFRSVRFGICICYDIEFPLLARSMCEFGAELLLSPSCTDSMAGYYRVETGCKARALENQCYVVQAPLVGDCDWTPAIDINMGAPGVFGPSDIGFPESGVVQKGQFNTPQILVHELDFAKVNEVRTAGAVRNFQDWDRQSDWKRISVQVISLDQ